MNASQVRLVSWKKRVIFFGLLFVLLLTVCTFVACAPTEDEPLFDSSWYGTYTAYNLENKGTATTIDKTGFYIDGEKIDCTVSGNRIKITSSGAIVERSLDGRALLYMLCTDTWQQAISGRNGSISGFSYTQSASGAVDFYWRFETYGSVSIFKSPKKYDGVYTINNGVLIEKFTSMNTASILLFQTCYIDEDYNIYLASIKDFDSYLDALENGSNSSSGGNSQNDSSQNNNKQ